MMGSQIFDGIDATQRRCACHHDLQRWIGMGLIIVLFCTPAAAFAAHTSSYDSCRESIDWLAWKEQRIYRAHLFGLTRARDAAISEVRFARDKSIWIKTQAGGGGVSPGSPTTVDEWRSLGEGYENVTWYNPLVDSQGDIRPRKGIFETRRRLSSELIPHATQAYRTFECRIEGICRLLELSESKDNHSPQNVTVDIFGCKDIPAGTFTACHLQTNPTPITTQGNLRQYCQTMVESLRKREEQVTKLVMEYDAGYRSVLQFSGILRSLLGEMRGTVLGSLRSATNLIASFSRVPCFIGSCDDAPSILVNQSLSSSSTASLGSSNSPVSSALSAASSVSSIPIVF